MVNGTAPLSSAPLFQADATDTVLLQAVHREQETLLSTCTQHQSCDQVHFTRAMIALFQNGEAATASFQQVIAVAPNGPFADSSTLWIRFLANRTVHPTSADEPNGPFADSSALWIRFLASRTVHPTSADEPNGALLEVMKGMVRTWLGQQRTASAPVTLRAVETAKSPEPAVPTLQRRIRDRDKRIAELTDQLHALKQIDLDSHEASKLSLPRTPSK
jgi:hypothetical protein